MGKLLCRIHCTCIIQNIARKLRINENKKSVIMNQCMLVQYIFCVVFLHVFYFHVLNACFLWNVFISLSSRNITKRILHVLRLVTQKLYIWRIVAIQLTLCSKFSYYMSHSGFRLEFRSSYLYEGYPNTVTLFELLKFCYQIHLLFLYRVECFSFSCLMMGVHGVH